jgi:BirA family biotin operon repressor/biotin-[acetyl-CoA-carboxylase] ligase
MDIFPARAGSIPVLRFESVGSTNAEALKLAEAGQLEPLFVVAERQSAGRGRRGRAWISEPGNLYTTLLLTDPAPPPLSAQLCFVAALALHDAVLDGCSGLAPSRLKLKWPNDLLLDEQKVAGILIEGTSTSGGGMAVAIGFGVNCKHHPAETQFPATDFAQAGFDLTPQLLLARLGERIEERLNEWQRGEVFSATRAAWLLRASGVGSAIEVRLLDRTLGGIFETINERGELILRDNDGGRQTISAGDIFPLNAKAN